MARSQMDYDSGDPRAGHSSLSESVPGGSGAETALGLVKGAEDPAQAIKAAEGFATVIVAGLTTDPPAAPPPVYAPVRIPPASPFGERPPRPELNPTDYGQPFTAGRSSSASSHSLVERLVAWWLRRPLD
jgi:hypothetical protein